MRVVAAVLVLLCAGCASRHSGMTYAMGGTGCCTITLTTEGYVENLPCLKQSHGETPKLLHEDSIVAGNACPCNKECICFEREKVLRERGYPVDLDKIFPGWKKK